MLTLLSYKCSKCETTVKTHPCQGKKWLFRLGSLAFLFCYFSMFLEVLGFLFLSSFFQDLLTSFQLRSTRLPPELVFQRRRTVLKLHLLTCNTRRTVKILNRKQYLMKPDYFTNLFSSLLQPPASCKHSRSCSNCASASVSFVLIRHHRWRHRSNRRRHVCSSKANPCIFNPKSYQCYNATASYTGVFFVSLTC